MSDEVTVHELLILETLGFDVIVEHPHPYVVKCIQLIRGRPTSAYVHVCTCRHTLIDTKK